MFFLFSLSALQDQHFFISSNVLICREVKGLCKDKVRRSNWLICPHSPNIWEVLVTSGLTASQPCLFFTFASSELNLKSSLLLIHSIIFTSSSLFLSCAGCDSEPLLHLHLLLSVFSPLLYPSILSFHYRSTPLLFQAATLLSNDLDRWWLWRGDRPVIRPSNLWESATWKLVFYLSAVRCSLARRQTGGTGAGSGGQAPPVFWSVWRNNMCMVFRSGEKELVWSIQGERERKQTRQKSPLEILEVMYLGWRWMSSYTEGQTYKVQNGARSKVRMNWQDQKWTNQRKNWG